jgi:hypothetical protein
MKEYEVAIIGGGPPVSQPVCTLPDMDLVPSLSNEACLGVKL